MTTLERNAPNSANRHWTYRHASCEPLEQRCLLTAWIEPLMIPVLGALPEQPGVADPMVIAMPTVSDNFTTVDTSAIELVGADIRNADAASTMNHREPRALPQADHRTSVVFQQMYHLVPGDAPTNLPPDAMYPSFNEDDTDPRVEKFQANDNERWTETAIDGGGLDQGDPTALTWSFVADGTWVLGSAGEPDSPSDLIAFLDGIYGNTTPDNNYTDEPWFIPFNSYLNRWGELSGLSYVYEPNDDGQDIPSNYPGIAGTRADLRIAGHPIDGEIGSNTLAYNFFPDYGDMVIDTGNLAFYSDLSGGSLNLRNTLAHEHGHGIGLSHVCPQSSGPDGRLMEPHDNNSIDGPQFDDILAVQRLYGDTLEKSGGNDSAQTAHPLGSLTATTVLGIGTNASDIQVVPAEKDFISIDDTSDTDFFSFTTTSSLTVNLLLTPHGPSYLSGPQNSNDTCFSGSLFDSSAQSDLTLALFGTDGSTILKTSDVAGLGQTESITHTLTEGTYFVRITGAQHAAQMYELQLSGTSNTNEPPVILSDGGGNTASIHVLENQNEVTDVNASDDSDTETAGLVYRLTGGSEMALFDLNAETGVLRFQRAPDFEMPADTNLNNHYQVQVTVTDSTNLTDVQLITVTVDDVDETDFGDAPDRGPGTSAGDYQTLASDNGPRHLVVTGLLLGDGVDGDTGTLQNIQADADDLHGIVPDDEDGVFNLWSLSAALGTSPTVTLLATNTTDRLATLSGWIDYDRDGLFDNTTERAQTSVVAGTTDSHVTLSFPPVSATSAGSTYARFRLSSDVAAQDPVGMAADGEVEDYIFTMTEPGTAAGSTKIASATGGGPTLTTNDSFGSSVAALGDLDGDGIVDLVVGTPGDDTGSSSAGAVHVLFMNSDGTARSSTKIASSSGGGPALGFQDTFGTSVAAVGDLDGDGVTELVVGAEHDGWGQTGAVYVLFMNSDGTAKSYTKITSGSGGGPALGFQATFGRSVASLGDLNDDGVADLAVGSHENNIGGFWRGAVHILFMDVDGTAKSTTTIGSGTGGGPSLSTGDHFGNAIVAPGDLDGDGVVDLAVGAYGDGSHGAWTGAVHVLFMRPDGTAKSTQKIASGDAFVLSPGDRFGSALAAPGDLDGDGVPDLAVGALQDDTGGIDRGAVHVLLLTPDGRVKTSTKISSGYGPSLNDFDEFGSSATALGDLNHDGVTELVVGAPGDGNIDNDKSGAVHVLFLDGGLVDTTPPTVSLLTRDGGDDSYDTLDKITVTFSETVDVSEGALSLWKETTDGTAVDLSEVSFHYDAHDFQAHWDFTAVAGMDPGFYTAVLDTTLVTDASGKLLDGDSNGTAGDDFEHTLLVAQKGDSDTDGDVDLSDYQRLATNFHPTGAAEPFSWLVGNFDGDTDVDLTDYASLAANFNPTGYGRTTELSLAHAADFKSVYEPSMVMRTNVQSRVSKTTSPFSLGAGLHGTDESSNVHPRIRRGETNCHQIFFARYLRDRHSLGTTVKIDATLDDADWAPLDN
jgi:hypothetical protein